MITKIAFFTIATNKYIKFLPNLIQSIQDYVHIDNTTIDCFAFTNYVIPPLELNNINVKLLTIDHLPWPLITLLRYQYIMQYAEIFKDYDYIFYIDADMEVVGKIGKELLVGDITAVTHPGQYNWPHEQCTYERNPRSKAHTIFNRKGYVIGAFQGGRTEIFLPLAQQMKTAIEQDLKNNYIAIWHDESHFNAVLAQIAAGDELFGEPVKVNYLDPSYCFPQNWRLPFTPKIIALDKNQSEIRSE